MHSFVVKSSTCRVVYPLQHNGVLQHSSLIQVSTLSDLWHV